MVDGAPGPTAASDMRTADDDAAAMSVAVIIPAYNAHEYIARCIEGLFAAGFSRHEILIIDDASTDDTRTIVRGLGVEPLALETNRGAAGARNAGAGATDADILFFVDADVVIHPCSRERIMRFFRERPDYVAVFGAYDADPAVETTISRFRNLLHRHVHVENGGDAVTFWTGCGAVRREAFERIGGFDPQQSMMEDVKLGLELNARGEKIWLDPAIQGKHLKRWTLTSMFRTDLLHRAIPWAQLLRTGMGGASSKALNLSLSGRLSGVAIAGSLLALPLILISPALAGGALAVSIALLAYANKRFLRNLWQERGLTEALAAIPLLWLHYLSACLGFAWVLLTPAPRA